jgi:hypothetical protein
MAAVVRQAHNLKVVGSNPIPALNLPRARAAAGDSERALQARCGSKLHKKSASGSYEKLPRSPQILRHRWNICGDSYFRSLQELTLSNLILWRTRRDSNV